MPDPFSILGLPPRFDLHPQQIQRAYLARSARLHPDVAAAGALDEGDGTGVSAAALNQARATLDRPDSRAEALLAALGGPSREQDRSLPAGFLEEMMDLRETIDAELEADRGAALMKWETWAAERRSSHERAVAAMFDALGRGDAAAGTEKNAAALKAVRMELNAWRYIERLIEQLRSAD